MQLENGLAASIVDGIVALLKLIPHMPTPLWMIFLVLQEDITTWLILVQKTNQLASFQKNRFS